MQNLSRIIAVTTLTLISSVSLAAFAERPYATVSVSTGFADDERPGGNFSDESTGFGAQFALAKAFHPHFAAEISLGSLGFSDASDNELDQFHAGLDLNVFFNGEGRFRPYFLVGGGIQRSELSQTGEDIQNHYADVGLGFLHKLNGYGMAFRTDVRLRRDFYDSNVPGTDDYDDIVANVGLVLPFGAPAAAPFEPVTEPEPIPEPAPADSDNDGVFDDQDECPNTPAGELVDEFGCTIEPEPEPEPISTGFFEHKFKDYVVIEIDKGEIHPNRNGHETIDEITEELIHRRYLVVEIEKTNGDRLSDGRAEEVKDHFRRRGISANRIRITDNKDNDETEARLVTP